jgi:alpha-galactosidase
MKKLINSRKKNSPSYEGRKPTVKAYGYRLLVVLLCLAWLTFGAHSVTEAENHAVLDNGTIRLDLAVRGDGVPVIERASWSDSGLPVFDDASIPDGLRSWIPEQFIPAEEGDPRVVRWHVTENSNFIHAVASRKLSGGLKIVWDVELARESALFRLHVRLKNTGSEPQAVDWFPAWAAEWDVAGGAEWVRWWKSLTFSRREKELALNEKVELQSRLHSSDIEGGENPYWVVGGDAGRMYFSLEWCGGWKANLQTTERGLSFSVGLPPEETQLVLEPGESIAGPALIIVPTRETDEMSHRRMWMAGRQALGQRLYVGPVSDFPLAYNHWYSIRRDVDARFLKRQLGAMSPYGFDAFVVDAGWYDEVGSWEPDPEKFEPGEFEDILSTVKGQGITAGIWSCPQFITVPEGEQLPAEVDDPEMYRSFVQGYLLDLAGSNFDDRMTSHITTFRERYSVDWWKFDQNLFAEESRAGVMKNVVAYQESLRAVRAANPDLFIESCQGGGRMINDLTLLACQIQWLRDGGETGLAHARQNIETVLGAMEFVFPWMAYSWTNRLDEMNQSDDELTRLYCRSSMAGTWGISADLSKIGDRQRNVILKEIQHYRRLSEIKRDGLYQLQPPEQAADVAKAIFYDSERKKAAVLLYRWDRRGAFSYSVPLDGLRAESSYIVSDVDSAITTMKKGKKLMKKGLSVEFPAERMSALLFIDIIE